MVRTTLEILQSMLTNVRAAPRAEAGTQGARLFRTIANNASRGVCKQVARRENPRRQYTVKTFEDLTYIFGRTGWLTSARGGLS